MMHATLSHGLLVENAVADFHYLIEKRQRFGSFEGHARAYLHAVALIAIGSKHFSRILTPKQLARKIRAANAGKSESQKCTWGQHVCRQKVRTLVPNKVYVL
jgi:hypothetical protein